VSEPSNVLRPTVVVVGGGYGGIGVAKALDDIADVVLVEPKDAFVHNVAVLRALVQPDWLPRVFLPYDRLLSRGRVVRDRAVRVEAKRVTLGSGEEIAADYIVLATGSHYPYPAKSDVLEADEASRHMMETHRALAAAGRVLLMGSGPVALELAGEILSVWPDKHVTITGTAKDILPGRYAPELRAELRRQLTDRGVEFVLGTTLTADPAPAPGVLETFTVETLGGDQITADVWFRCHGVAPVTGYLAEELAGVRTPKGYLRVTSDLRLDGQHTVFAIGDIAAIDTDMAMLADMQAKVAADNIRALITGEGEIWSYQPMPPGILLPLGPEGGAGQFAGQDGVVPAEVVAEFKGRAMFVDRYAEILGLSSPDARQDEHGA
jgi:NADH dehydrogenase FAD-containing subunit